MSPFKLKNMSKLRKFEINAIVDTVYDQLKTNIESKFKEEAELFANTVLIEEQKLQDFADKMNEEIENFNKKFDGAPLKNTNYFTSVADRPYQVTKPKFRFSINTKENLIRGFINHHSNEKLPSRKVIERDVVISNRSDLEGIVESLISKYS